MRSSSVIRLLLVAFLTSFLFGCYVMEELDNANAEMHRNDPKPETEVATGDTDSGSSGESAIAQARKKSAEWWKNATTLSKDGLDDSVVTCRLDGRKQFMRRDDCLTRGGEEL